MSFRFNADDILQMALNIERNGAKFYRTAAELEQTRSSSAMLQELAAMEDDHEKTFQDMRDNLTDEERKETTYDPHGELPDYLQAMADKGVFKKGLEPAKQLRGDESIEDILRLAIGMEKDSVVFYLALQELVPDRLGGARVDEILQEEIGHIAQLGDLLRCAGK
ncbi:MAG: ferritin family protein [Armatimonadetes bacterium]|nr:ferritin family protein [Armatimonadota bacterium]